MHQVGGAIKSEKKCMACFVERSGCWGLVYRDGVFAFCTLSLYTGVVGLVMFYSHFESKLLNSRGMAAKRLRDPQAASHKHLGMGIPTALLIDEQVEKTNHVF